MNLMRDHVIDGGYGPSVPLAIKAIMISFKVSQLYLISLKRNNVKISNKTIMIVLIAKGTQGVLHAGSWL